MTPSGATIYDSIASRGFIRTRRKRRRDKIDLTKQHYMKMEPEPAQVQPNRLLKVIGFVGRDLIHGEMLHVMRGRKAH